MFKHAWLGDRDLLAHTPNACLEHWLPHEFSPFHPAFDCDTVLPCILLGNHVPLAMCVGSSAVYNVRGFFKEIVNETSVIKVTLCHDTYL